MLNKIEYAMHWTVMKAYLNKIVRSKSQLIF